MNQKCLIEAETRYHCKRVTQYHETICSNEPIKFQLNVY